MSSAGSEGGSWTNVCRSASWKGLTLISCHHDISTVNGTQHETTYRHIIYIYMIIYVVIYVSICPSIYPSTYLSIYLSLPPPLHVSISRSICLSICFCSIYLSLNRSIYIYDILHICIYIYTSNTVRSK